MPLCLATTAGCGVKRSRVFYLGATMRYCSFCGAEIPDQARFCGHCGHTLQFAPGEARDVATGGTHEDASTFISDASYPAVVVANSWPGQGEGPDSWPKRDLITEEETIVAAPFPFFPGAGDVQTGPGVPTVHGTPQTGHVPTVHGTPAAGGGGMHAAPGMGLHSAPDSNMHPFAHTPLPHTPLPHPLEATLPAQHTPQPPYAKHTAPEKNSPYHHHATHTAPEKPHLHEERPPEHAAPRETIIRHKHARPRVRIDGKRKLTWVVASAAAMIVIASGITLLLVTVPASLSLRGGNTVFAGGALHLHGSGFLPGQHVALWLDNHASFNDNPVADHAGTFDAMIKVSDSWTLGSHTLHGSQNFARSATVSFTVVPLPARLVTAATSISFGEMESEKTIILSLGIGNGGGQPLRWKASAGNTSWLEVLQGTGIINANGQRQFVYVRADSTHLRSGTYTASLAVDSNGGNTSLPVSLQVKQRVPQRAVLYVNQAGIDLGQLEVGQQTAAAISIANEGTLALNWQASAGGAGWLTFDSTSGQIQAGKIPQIVHMMVDTSSLSPGSYSATVRISSNGGSATIGVTLQVFDGQTPVTTVPTPTLGARPNGFNAPQDPNCSYDQYHGWTCTAQLNNAASTQASLNWSASSTGISGVTFTPASGALTPGQPESISIFIPNTPCPAAATFTFSGPGNSISLPWNCSPAQLLTDPTSFPNACQSCTVRLSLPQGAEGELQWNAASVPSSGITVSQTSGTLLPGQSATVTFSGLPASCDSTFDFHFTSPNNGVDVLWGCQIPQVTVSPQSINANTDCPYNAGWTCTITLSLGQSGTGTLAWSASGSGINGITFNPQSGTLSAGQPGVVTVTVPPTSCPASATLTFTFPSLPSSTITWNCNPPTLLFNPSSFNAPSSACSYSFISEGFYWSCQETLSLQNQGDPDVDWSTPGGVGGSSVGYSPASGTVSASQPASVTITIPDMACPASTTLTFLAGGNAFNIPWQCSTPSWLIKASNPGNPSVCPTDDNGNVTCNLTISEDASSQGDLSWSITSDLSGVSYNPTSSGLITPGNWLALTITVPGNACTSTGTFTIADNQGTDTQTATLSCSSSSPTPTPTATDTPTPTSTATDTPTPTATDTPTPTATDTPTPTPTATDTPTPTATDTPTPTAPPTATDTPTPEATDTPTPTAAPTDTPTPTDTSTPTSFVILHKV